MYIDQSRPEYADIHMVSQDIHEPLPTECEKTAHRWFIGFIVTLPFIYSVETDEEE